MVQGTAQVDALATDLRSLGHINAHLEIIKVYVGLATPRRGQVEVARPRPMGRALGRLWEVEVSTLSVLTCGRLRHHGLRVDS